MQDSRCKDRRRAELVPEVVSLSLRAVRARTARGAAGSPDTAYLLQLAQEISALPKSEWLQDLGAWEEVLRLAFSYLDIDGDDLLSLKDLASLVEAPSAAEAEQQVHSWMSRWHVDRRSSFSTEVVSQGVDQGHPSSSTD